MANLRKYTVLLTAETQDALRGIDAVKDAISGLHRVTMRMGRAIAGMVQETADYGDEMAIAAAKANVNTQQWMKLVHAADIAGVKQHHLMTFFRRMGDNAQDAAGGTGMAVDELTNLFGSLDKMPKGQFELFEAIIGPIGELLNGTDEQMRRAGGMMSSIGGRSGGLIAPLLKLGLGNLRALMKEAEDFGLVLDPDITDATQKWNDEVIRVKRSFEGIRNTVGARLLPQVMKLATMTQKWVREQRELIDAGLEPWLKAVEIGIAETLMLMDRFRRAFKQFMAPLKTVIKGLSRFVQLIAVGSTLLTGLAAFATSSILLAGVLWAVHAAWVAFAATLAPWIALASGVILTVFSLFLIFEDFITLLRGGDSLLGEWLDKLGLLGGFREMLEAWRDVLKDIQTDQLLEDLRTLFDFLENTAKPILKWFIDAASKHFGQKAFLRIALLHVMAKNLREGQLNAKAESALSSAGERVDQRKRPRTITGDALRAKGWGAIPDVLGVEAMGMWGPASTQSFGRENQGSSTTVNFTNNAIPAEQLGPVIQSQIDALAFYNMNREGGP